MNSSPNHDLKSFLYPYAFALKEGAEIQGDRLNYSLLMFHVGIPEVIKSPNRSLPTLPNITRG